MIGKFLISSPTFPPLHTVRATFAAHRVPSFDKFFFLLIYLRELFDFVLAFSDYLISGNPAIILNAFIALISLAVRFKSLRYASIVSLWVA